MTKNDKSRKDFGIGIFNQIVDQFSEYSKENGKRIYHIKKIKKDHLALLLAWPGIFTYKLVLRTNEEELNNKFKKIHNSILSSDEDINLHDNIEKDLKEMIDDVFHRAYFLTHPNSIHFNTNKTKELIHHLSNYFINCCFLFDLLNNKDSEADIKFLSSNDVINIISEYTIKNNIINYLQLVSLWWNYQSLYYSGMDPDFTDNISTDNKNRSWKLKLKETINNQNIVNNNIPGFAVNLNMTEKLSDYISIYAVSLGAAPKGKDPFCDGYIFHKKFNLDKNIYNELFNYLNSLAKLIVNIGKELNESLDIFIDAPEKVILPKLHNEAFREYIKKIIKSKHFLDIVINFEDLNRSILSADAKFDGVEQEYTSVRNILATAERKKPEIPLEIRDKLLEANEEICKFIDIIWDRDPILNENLYLDDEGIFEYLNRHRNEYKYLRYIDISVFSGLNLRVNKYIDKRDLSRNALPIIKNHIEGKPNANTMPKILLRKILGLE